jgi:hypothetical protein
MDQNQIKWIDYHVFKVSSIESPVGKFSLDWVDLPSGYFILLKCIKKADSKTDLKMDQNRIKWIDCYV